MSARVSVQLEEWRSATPESHPALKDVKLDKTACALAEALTESQRLSIVPRLDGGITIEANSHVGIVTVGPLRIAIEPKIKSATLLQLLRYAYGLRNLTLYEEHGASTATACFQDLLLQQLAAEANELLARGLHRRYQARSEPLAVPRGRIDFQKVVAGGGLATAALPCRHYAREEDCFPNQVLRAGLLHGARLAGDPMLATHLRQTARRMDGIGEAPLDRHTFDRIRREQNRLLAAYEPAFALIELLVIDAGATVAEAEEVRLPGFLFDMNRFFEALLGRFLTDFLPDCKVIEQQALTELFAWDKDHNPRKRPAPRPRPDFVVQGAARTAVLDAKYRDLWARELPREMLYQLAIYSLCGLGHGEATILYPTVARAEEQRVAIHDPLRGGRLGTVILRPVPIVEMAALLSAQRTSEVDARCRAIARQLAFGEVAGPVRMSAA